MAELTNNAEGSAALTESFNNVGAVLSEDGLAAQVEEFVQPQNPESEPEQQVTEAEVSDENQGQPEEDLSHSEESEDSSGESRGVQKRIDKLVKQRKDAEADADGKASDIGDDSL